MFLYYNLVCQTYLGFKIKLITVCEWHSESVDTRVGSLSVFLDFELKKNFSHKSKITIPITEIRIS